MTLRVLRTIQQGHDNEMKMSAESCATQIPFTLSQCGVEKCGSVCQLCIVMCAREKMCVCARTSTCGVYTSLSHSRLLPLAECETQIQQLLWKKKRTRLQSDKVVEGDNVELVVLSRVASVSWMLFRLH